ncbi:FecR protein domain protein [Candidatus Magnetoovum chiemensis]|nr:FecR protein domain protein [Candidatus Magnetoovum chiemensis]
MRKDDVISVYNNATVDILFDKGKAMRVKENTTIKIDTYEGSKRVIKTSLNKGKVLYNVEKKKKAPLLFEVKTPNIVAGIRGTEFLVNHYKSSNTYFNELGEEITDVKVKEGAVNLRSKQRNTLNIDLIEGKSFTITSIGLKYSIEDLSEDDNTELKEISEIPLEEDAYDNFLKAFKHSYFFARICYLLTPLTRSEMKNIAESIKIYSEYHNDMPDSLIVLDLNWGRVNYTIFLL